MKAGARGRYLGQAASIELKRHSTHSETPFMTAIANLCTLYGATHTSEDSGKMCHMVGEKGDLFPHCA